MKKVKIVRKGFKFTLYRLPNGKLELVTPVPRPAPGYDVIHILSPEEASDWEQKGESALNDRIADMKQNPKKYRMLSWR